MCLLGDATIYYDMCLGVSLETGDWREGGEAAAAAAKKNILLVISCLVAVVFLPVEKGGSGAHACMHMYDVYFGVFPGVL